MDERDVKAHWYSLCFMHGEGGSTAHSTVYRGQGREFISKTDIDNAKKYANAPEHAVMLSCSYLGFATKKEMGLDT